MSTYFLDGHDHQREKLAIQGAGAGRLLTKKLLLIDLENKHKVDLSLLDESFRVIIFVGDQPGYAIHLGLKSTRV